MNQLRQEVAFLALHLHWELTALMTLEHSERRQWVREVVRLLPAPSPR